MFVHENPPSNATFNLTQHPMQNPCILKGPRGNSLLVNARENTELSSGSSSIELLSSDSAVVYQRRHLNVFISTLSSLVVG